MHNTTNTRSCPTALALLLLVSSLCADEPAQDSWKPLFNGRDLSGWTVKCKPADRDQVCWRVEDSVLVADSMDVPKHDYIWLVSDQEYSDFVLRLRFQAFRGNPGNSGVQVRSRYDDEAGWLDGPQVDINPPGPWRTGMVWDETRGVQHWLHPKVPRGQWVDASMSNPALKFYFSDDPTSWNELEITARGPRLQAVLNGVRILDYDGAGVLDDALHQQRRVGMRGHLALQIHTGDRLRIRFKDIRIQTLAP
jgi:hypothetical protein